MLLLLFPSPLGKDGAADEGLNFALSFALLPLSFLLDDIDVILLHHVAGDRSGCLLDVVVAEEVVNEQLDLFPRSEAW